MTKEEAYEKATMQELGGNPNGTRQDVVWRAMDIYSRHQATCYGNFILKKNFPTKFSTGVDTSKEDNELYDSFLNNKNVV